MDEFQDELVSLPGCHVFKLPPMPPGGYKAADWEGRMIWTGTCKVIAKGESAIVRLQDTATGQLFAESPIEANAPGGSASVITPVTDSSRFFVMRVQEGDRHAFIGIGFDERTQAFDFNVAITDFKQQTLRAKQARQNASEAYVPKHDFSAPAAGQKIKINLAGKLKKPGQ